MIPNIRIPNYERNYSIIHQILPAEAQLHL